MTISPIEIAQEQIKSGAYDIEKIFVAIALHSAPKARTCIAINKAQTTINWQLILQPIPSLWIHANEQPRTHKN